MHDTSRGVDSGGEARVNLQPVCTPRSTGVMLTVIVVAIRVEYELVISNSVSTKFFISNLHINVVLLYSGIGSRHRVGQGYRSCSGLFSWE
jgi:hypothetical protein